ncbi:MAG: hypothetical protein ACI3YD_04875 [Alloprevotella sp.]
MSALSILTLVLPLPLLFVWHEVEEVWVQHRWMQTHRAGLEVANLRFAHWFGIKVCGQ